MAESSPQKHFESLKLTLPPAPKPVGVYKPALVVGQHLYVSGHGPLLPDNTLMRGRVGRDLDADAGKRAARQVGLTMLATLPRDARQPRQDQAGDQGARDGQLHGRFREASLRDQRCE